MRFSKVEEKEFTGETNQKIRKMAFPCIKNRGKDLDIQNLETLLGMLERIKKNTQTANFTLPMGTTA